MSWGLPRLRLWLHYEWPAGPAAGVSNNRDCSYVYLMQFDSRLFHSNSLSIRLPESLLKKKPFLVSSRTPRVKKPDRHDRARRNRMDGRKFTPLPTGSRSHGLQLSPSRI